MIKLLFWKKEKHYLSAEQTKNLLMYGFKNITLQEAVNEEVDDLESSIKLKAGSGFRLVTKTYPVMKSELIEGLKEHFSEKGFLVDVYKNPKIPDFAILIIGW